MGSVLCDPTLLVSRSSYLCFKSILLIEDQSFEVNSTRKILHYVSECIRVKKNMKQQDLKIFVKNDYCGQFLVLNII